MSENMVCCMCGKPAIEKYWANNALCFACTKRAITVVRSLASTVKNGAVSIMWDGGRIGRSEWIELKKFVVDKNIKSIIEYGPGLTTELLSLEQGVEAIYSIEANDYWYEIMKAAKPLHTKTTFVYFPRYKDIPDDLAGLRPMYDLSLVDGPDSGRDRSILHAVKHSKYMYLHDPFSADQVAVLSDISKNNLWKPINSLSQKGGQHRFWEKVSDGGIAG